jgi:hypothetical protein
MKPGVLIRSWCALSDNGRRNLVVCVGAMVRVFCASAAVMVIEMDSLSWLAMPISTPR